MHNRVNKVLVTYIVIAISAYECMTFQQKQGSYSSDLYVRQTLQRSSDIQQIDSNETEDHRENGTDPSTESHSAWPFVLGSVIAVLSIVLLIAVAVKYRLFKCCLPRNSHDLLLDGDTASQFSQIGALEEGVPKRGMRGRMSHTGGDSSNEDNDDDDDGFIEDNYIQASERARAKHEENHQEVGETDDELIIPDIV